MVKVSHALNHSAKEAVQPCVIKLWKIGKSGAEGEGCKGQEKVERRNLFKTIQATPDDGKAIEAENSR